MIGHDLHFKDFRHGFISDALDNLFEPLVDRGNQNLAAILRAEDDMVLAGVRPIVV